MKNLNFIFDLVLFPFLCALHLFQYFYKRVYTIKKELLSTLFLLFTATSMLQAADVTQNVTLVSGDNTATTQNLSLGKDCIIWTASVDGNVTRIQIDTGNKKVKYKFSSSGCANSDIASDDSLGNNGYEDEFNSNLPISMTAGDKLYIEFEKNDEDSVAKLIFTFSGSSTLPIANAGPDQTIAQGDTVNLDGSGSTGTNLTYLWTITSKPAGSTASLLSNTAVNPTFIVDTDGTYVVSLVVNDGTVDSVADSVTIYTSIDFLPDLYIYCSPLSTFENGTIDLGSDLIVIGTNDGNVTTPSLSGTGTCYDSSSSTAVSCGTDGSFVDPLTTIPANHGTASGSETTLCNISNVDQVYPSLKCDAASFTYSNTIIRVNGTLKLNNSNSILNISNNVEIHTSGSIEIKIKEIRFAPNATLTIYTDGNVVLGDELLTTSTNMPPNNFKIYASGTIETGSYSTTNSINALLYSSSTITLGSGSTLNGSVTAHDIIGGSNGATIDASTIENCGGGDSLIFYDAGRVDAVDKYLTDGHALGTGLKTRVAQKSYAPDTSSNPNLYSVDAVYLGADETNAETFDAADMPVFFYLTDDNCENHERMQDNNGDWLTAVIVKNAIYGTTPAFTLTEVQRRRRLGIRYIDYEALITDGGPTCLQNSSQGANAVPGLPSCVSSDDQYLDAFHQAAFDRCKMENGEPCNPSHHGYSGGGDPTYPGYTEQYDHEYGCYECTLGTSPGVCSSDNFAIRPNDFDVVISHIDYPNLLRAGQDYNISLTARSADNSIPTDYNITDHNWLTDLDANTTKYFKNGVEDTLDLLEGTATVDTSAIAFSVAGLSSFSTAGPAISGTADKVIPVSYNDVGKVNLLIYDKNWAEVDNDDTPMDCDDSHAHTYICGDQNVTFIPHHFAFAELNITNHAGPDTNFTYIADNRGMPSTTPPTRSPMAARVQTQIRALTKDDNITLNFKAEDALYPYSEIDETTRQYYENPVNVSFVVTVPAIGTNTYLYPDANETNTTTISDPNLYNYIGFGRVGIDSIGSGTRDILWNESNFPLDFNFQREINEPANPFDVNGTHLKSIKIISHYVDPDDPTKTADINGSRISEDSTCATGDDGCVVDNADNNATFYYGRARPSQYFYDDITASSVNTPIAIDVYCDLLFTECFDMGIDTDNAQINEVDWWLSLNHTENSTRHDGNITLQRSPAGSAMIRAESTATEDPAEVRITSGGIDKNVTVTATIADRPLTINIELVHNMLPVTLPYYTATPPYTNSWLIYNPDNNSIPSPFYRVRFRGQNDWAGHGDTGHVVDSATSYKKNRRLEW